MSKNHKREPHTTSKPAPPICRYEAGMPCFEIAKLQEENKKLKNRIGALELQVTIGKAVIALEKCNTALYRKSYDQSLKRETAARADYFQAHDRLLATTKELDAYRRALKAMRIINIIFTVGFAVMTAILIWR
jgi:hypothetical protein